VTEPPGLPAAAIEGGHGERVNDIGYCAGRLGQWDEAARNLREAIRLDPTFDLPRNNLAWVQRESLNAVYPPARQMK
jgi:Flp pilus assembly protein TadD